MKSKVLVAILSTLCFLPGCKTVPQTEPLRPDLANPERMVCEDVPDERPPIPALYEIDWSQVVTLAQARAEHEKYAASVRARSGAVAAYIVTIEGKLFVCSNNAQWWRDYWRGLGRRAA